MVWSTSGGTTARHIAVRNTSAPTNTMATDGPRLEPGTPRSGAPPGPGRRPGTATAQQHQGVLTVLQRPEQQVGQAETDRGGQPQPERGVGGEAAPGRPTAAANDPAGAGPGVGTLASQLGQRTARHRLTVRLGCAGGRFGHEVGVGEHGAEPGVQGRQLLVGLLPLGGECLGPLPCLGDQPLGGLAGRRLVELGLPLGGGAPGPQGDLEVLLGGAAAVSVEARSAAARAAAASSSSRLRSAAAASVSRPPRPRPCPAPRSPGPGSGWPRCGPGPASGRPRPSAGWPRRSAAAARRRPRPGPARRRAGGRRAPGRPPPRRPGGSGRPRRWPAAASRGSGRRRARPGWAPRRPWRPAA